MKRRAERKNKKTETFLQSIQGTNMFLSASDLEESPPPTVHPVNNLQLYFGSFGGWKTCTNT